MNDTHTQSDTEGALSVAFAKPPQLSKENSSPSVQTLYERPLSSLSKNGEQKVRASFNVNNGLSGSSAEEGTFVSDRKRSHPSFFQNVALAFSEWKSKLGNSHQDAVPLTETLPESIQKPDIQNVDKNAVVIEKITTLQTPSIPPVSQPVPPPSSHIISPESEIGTSTPVVTSIPKNEESLAVEKHVPPTSVLKKIRTLASDAHLAQGNSETTAHLVPPKPTPAPSTPPVSQPVPPPTKPVVPEAYVTEFDMRASMIAPDVALRVEVPQPPSQSVTPPPTKQPLQTPVPQPSLVSSASPSQTTVRSEVHTPSDETPQWTHVREGNVAYEELPLSELHSVTPPTPASQDVFENTLSPDIFVVPPSLTPQDATEPKEDTVTQNRATQIAEKIKTIRSASTHSETESENLSLVRESFTPYEQSPLEQSPIVEHEPELSGDVSQQYTPSARTITSETPSTSITQTLRSIQKERVPKSSTSTSFRFSFRFVAVLILLGIGSVGGTYFFLFVKPHQETSAPVTVPAPIIQEPTPSHISLTGTTQTILAQLQEAVASAQPGVTTFSVFSNGSSQTATAQEFFTAIQAHLSTRAITALEPVFTVGSITTTKNEPFIRIRSTHFDTLFAGLLAWEPMMYTDLAPLFKTEATTSLQFTDAVQNNISVRVLRDTNGTVVMLYAFIDADAVIITRSMEALSKLREQF